LAYPKPGRVYSYGFKPSERKEIKTLIKKMQTKSLKSGMSSSNKIIKEERILNKRSSDPFDQLIFEKGLRIKQLMADKNLNTMIILLNNGHALKVPINHFIRLKNASQADLDKWTLSGNGVGIRWDNIDEDLSLKGLIKDSALASILHRLENKKGVQELSVL